MSVMIAPDDPRPAVAVPKKRGRPRTGAQMEAVRGLKTGRAPPPPRFRHRDLKYAIKAGIDAGLDMEKYRVEVDTKGTISLVPIAGDLPAEPDEGANEWEERMKKLGLDP